MSADRIDARESFGSYRAVGVTTLDDALAEADVVVREFLGDRSFVVWQTSAEPLLTNEGRVLCWNVEVLWRVTS